MSLLSIDSRDRENYDDTDAKDIKIVFDRSISFQKISLIFFDLPVIVDETVEDITDNESCYYLNIKQLPFGVRGASYSDRSSFILMRTSDLNQRTIQFENTSYTQTIDLGRKVDFSEFDISIRYRKNATAVLNMSSDWSALFRID